MTTHVGLIGGGNITETHARAARAISGVAIAAIYGTNAQKVSRLCAEHGGKAYADFEGFLAHRPMDLVMIGSPSGCHASQGIAAAQRGLHVLTEKPIDVSTKSADALIDAARQSKVKLGVIFQDRMKPDIQRLKQLIDKSVLGKPLLIDAQVKWYRPAEYYADSKWRGSLALDGGGALINQGVHTVDLLLWLLGDAVRVQARTATLLHRIEAEDTAVAIIEFAGGALCNLVATTAVYPGYPRRVEISGTRGTVILEHDRIVAADIRDADADLHENVAGDTNASASSAVVSDIRGHQAVLEDFLRAIRQDSEPACNGEEARRPVALIEKIYRAARTV
jgi:UDP-N-acetyl-2-amino-2-deoxyglucuronate dehydrogenase